jgi:hypothetical protein
MPDNPLGPVQGVSSQKGEINSTDWKRVGRLMLVQLIGLGVTLGVPALLKLHYVWGGHDYTAEVLVIVNGCAELARRFLTGAPKT